MEKIKLTIQNNGCNPIKVFGRPCIDIPALGTVSTIHPDTPQTAALIERLRRHYPFLVITREKEDAPVATAGEQASGKTPSGKQATEKSPSPQASSPKDKAEPTA